MSPSHLRFCCFYLHIFFLIYLLFQIIILIVLKSLEGIGSDSNSLKILKLYKDLASDLNHNAQFDNAGRYKILQATSPTTNSSTFDITLVSQCSSNLLHLLEEILNVWKGPVSVAVFSEVNVIEFTVWEVARLMQCRSERDIILHLVVPAQSGPYINDFKYAYDQSQTVSCEGSQVPNVIGRKNYNWEVPYPVNLIRNVAKIGSRTDYILVIDIDIVPSVNLRHDFLNYVRSEPPSLEKVVHVIPIFEIPLKANAPQNKVELREMVKRKQAQPFYFSLCRGCQKYTQYNRWFAAMDGEGTKPLFTVQWKHPWEPFFIARRDVPNFDERFMQYGMNRVSQICELHVAGYKFVVLDNVFLIHRGLKTPAGFHRSKSTDMKHNKRLYEKFKEELRYRYPNSKRTC